MGFVSPLTGRNKTKITSDVQGYFKEHSIKDYIDNLRSRHVSTKNIKGSLSFLSRSTASLGKGSNRLSSDQLKDFSRELARLVPQEEERKVEPSPEKGEDEPLGGAGSEDKYFVSPSTGRKIKVFTYKSLRPLIVFFSIIGNVDDYVKDLSKKNKNEGEIKKSLETIKENLNLLKPPKPGGFGLKDDKVNRIRKGIDRNLGLAVSSEETEESSEPSSGESSEPSSEESSEPSSEEGSEPSSGEGLRGDDIPLLPPKKFTGSEPAYFEAIPPKKSEDVKLPRGGIGAPAPSSADSSEPAYFEAIPPKKSEDVKLPRGGIGAPAPSSADSSGVIPEAEAVQQIQKSDDVFGEKQPLSGLQLRLLGRDKFEELKKEKVLLIDLIQKHFTDSSFLRLQEICMENPELKEALKENTLGQYKKTELLVHSYQDQLGIKDVPFPVTAGKDLVKKQLIEIFTIIKHIRSKLGKQPEDGSVLDKYKRVGVIVSAESLGLTLQSLMEWAEAHKQSDEVGKQIKGLSGLEEGVDASDISVKCNEVQSIPFIDHGNVKVEIGRVCKIEDDRNKNIPDDPNQSHYFGANNDISVRDFQRVMVEDLGNIGKREVMKMSRIL